MAMALRLIFSGAPRCASSRSKRKGMTMIRGATNTTTASTAAVIVTATITIENTHTIITVAATWT